MMFTDPPEIWKLTGIVVAVALFGLALAGGSL
jgi:hypothetical protein